MKTHPDSRSDRTKKAQVEHNQAQPFEAPFAARLNCARELRVKLDRVPEIRWDRVDELRGAICAGRYQVNNETLAADILKDLYAIAAAVAHRVAH